MTVVGSLVKKQERDSSEPTHNVLLRTYAQLHIVHIYISVITHTHTHESKQHGVTSSGVAIFSPT
jgi:hypothetical protein